MAGGGQQPGVAQQAGEPAVAAVGQAAEFHVPPGGEGEETVPQLLRGVGQCRCLTYRQISGRYAHSGEQSVGGSMQPQRPRAGVTAVP